MTSVLGIRAINTDGDVLEFRADAQGNTITVPDLAGGIFQNHDFPNVCLLAFYAPGGQFPHLVFPCLPTQSVARYASGSYELVAYFPCPLLHGYDKNNGELAVGEYLITVSDALFGGSGNPGPGVVFNGVRVTTDTNYEFPIIPNVAVKLNSSDFHKADRQFAIYGAAEGSSQNPFGSSFGLMGRLGRSAASVTVRAPSGLQPTDQPPNDACVALGRVADNSPPSGLSGQSPTFCPGYELNFTGAATASLSIILGEHGRLVAKDLVLGSGLIARCTVDPNFYMHDALNAKLPPASPPAAVPWIIEIDNVDARALAPIWNAVIAKPYLRSIRTVDDGNDLSFMPVLTDAAAPSQGALNLVYRAQQTWGDDGSVDATGKGSRKQPNSEPELW